MGTNTMQNPLDFSTLPDLPRPSSSAYNRTSWSPSRSPARSPTRFGRGAYYDYGSVYKDLSPGTTLRVIKASLEHASNINISDEKLVKSIDTASVDDKNFGLKCAESSKLVKAWVDELEEWPWDWDHGVSTSGSFLRGSTGFPIPTPNSEDERNLRSIESQDSMVKDLPQFEQRLDEIRQDLRDLDMEEQKDFVRKHIQVPAGSHALPSSSEVSHADGLTALITMTVLQALPYYSRLLTLIACWSARLNVYQDIPSLRRKIEAAREAQGVAWSIVTKDKTFLASVGEEHGSVIARSRLTQEFLDSLKSDLRDVIMGLGKKLDSMLDMLRRNGDDLPHKWIDAVEALEHDFHSWTLEAPKIFVRQESQPSRKNSSVPEEGQIEDATQDVKTHRVSMANEMLQTLVSNHNVGEEVSQIPSDQLETDRPTTMIYNPQPQKQAATIRDGEDWSNGSFFSRSSTPETEPLKQTQTKSRIGSKPAITVEDPTAQKFHIRDASTDFSEFNFGAANASGSKQHERGRSPVSPSRESSLRSAGKRIEQPSNAPSAEEDAPQVGIAHSMSWDELDEHIATRTFVKASSPSPAPSFERTPQKTESQTASTPPTVLSAGSSSFKPVGAGVSPWDELDDHIANRKFWKPPSPSPAKQPARIPKEYLRGAGNLGEDLPLAPARPSQDESRPSTAWDELDEHIATRHLVQPLPKDLPRPPRSTLSSNGMQLANDDDSFHSIQPTENFETMAAGDDHQTRGDDSAAKATENHEHPIDENMMEAHVDSSDQKQPDFLPTLPASDLPSGPTTSIEETDAFEKSDAHNVPDPVKPIEEPQLVEELRKEELPREEEREADISTNDTSTEAMQDYDRTKTLETSEPELPQAPIVDESQLDSADIPLPSIEHQVEPEASTQEVQDGKDVSESLEDDDESLTRDQGDELESEMEDGDGSPLSLSTSRSRLDSTFDGDSALAALEYASPISETPEYDASQQALPDVDDEEDAQGKYENVVKDLKVKKTRKPHLQTYTNKDLGLDEHGNPLKVKYKKTHARHLSDADRKLEQKIDSLLPNIPASIEFKKEPPRSPGQAILEQFKKRSAIRKGLATPDLTLEPAFQQTTKSSRSGFASEIKLYHLTSADRAEPIKLYVRLVGESAERVMVRVGGGWADLGEYLRDFAMHHARVASSGDGKGRPASRMSSLSPQATPANAADRRNFSLPSKIPSKIPSAKTAGNKNTLSASTGSRTASRLSTRTASRQGSRAASRASPRPDDDETPTLGMSGPRSNTGAASDMSEEQQRWVDTMLERAKEFRPSEKGGPQLEDMGRANNTRRVYKVADVSGSGSNGNADR